MSTKKKKTGVKYKYKVGLGLRGVINRGYSKPEQFIRNFTNKKDAGIYGAKIKKLINSSGAEFQEKNLISYDDEIFISKKIKNKYVPIHEMYGETRFKSLRKGIKEMKIDKKHSNIKFKER